MKPSLRIVEILPGLAGVEAAIAAVHELFEDDISVAIVPANDAAALTAVKAELPRFCDEPSLVLTTSGSLGEAKAVEISVTALATAAEFAAISMQTPALWLTALPVTGIGGLNTVVRSALAGTQPVIWDGVAGAASFEAADFNRYLRAARVAADKQKMAAAVSLVPTQIARLANHDLSVLKTLDFVLVGGARLSAELSEQLLAAGVNLIKTYGASETCGGVWWNQQPLGDTKIEISEIGEVLIQGSTLATAYRDGTAISPIWASGDIGEIVDGKLQITGRRDRVIKTRGQKISLDLITATAENLASVQAAYAVGIRDADAGEIAVLTYVGKLSETEIKQQLLVQLPELSFKVLKLSELPVNQNGKADTAELVRICETSPL